MAETAEAGEATVLAIREVPASTTLFGTEDPREIVAFATRQANELARVVKERNLTTEIAGRQHVRIEGWTLLGTFLGVYPVETFTRPVPADWRERGLERPEGYEARVEARTRDGAVVGAANARCLFDEVSGTRKDGSPIQPWKNRPDYALASMAQTRSASKALRMPLGFVVVLAGFDATPAEEMDGAVVGGGGTKAATKKSATKRSTAKPAATAKPETQPDSVSESAEDVPVDDTRELWKEAVSLLKSRGEVVKWYREEFDAKGSVNPRDVTAEQLRQIIALAREAKGAKGSA